VFPSDIVTCDSRFDIQIKGKEFWQRVTRTVFTVLLYTALFAMFWALHKDRPRTCRGALLQVTAISAEQEALCCEGRKWGSPNQNASVLTVNLTVRRQARLFALPLASCFS
jgi:hypothetical protein